MVDGELFLFAALFPKAEQKPLPGWKREVPLRNLPLPSGSGLLASLLAVETLQRRDQGDLQCTNDDALATQTLCARFRKYGAPEASGDQLPTRILKVAWTIADLAGARRIEVDHLAEAVQYRALYRSLW